MSKQYHFVLMVDADTNELSIDWDTTQIVLEEDRGTVFDTDTQEWDLGFSDQNYENVANKLADKFREIILN